MLNLLTGMFHVSMFRSYPYTNNVQWTSSYTLERFSNFFCLARDMSFGAQCSSNNMQENHFSGSKYAGRLLFL